MKLQVLQILLSHKNQPISGEKIAKELGISRNAVWKAVQSLRQEGFVIEAVTNSGYMLCSEGQTLTPASILLHLSEKSSEQFQIVVKQSVGSTNTELKAMAESGAKEGQVLIAEEQTSGKGRLGRSFHSPLKSGLYMSILLRPKFAAADSVFITVAAASAVAESIESVANKKTGIKWVNDIYISNKKICGILTEASLDFESGNVNYAVVGIGINLLPPQGDFPEEIREIAGAVFEEELPEGAKAKLAAEILTRFMQYYQHLTEKKFMRTYQERSILTDCAVTFTQGNRQEKGIVVGISPQAELIVRLSNGKIAKYSSGEAVIDKKSLYQILQSREESEDEC